MKQFLPEMSGQMIQEARQAKRKPHWLLQTAIGCIMMMVSQLLIAVLLIIPILTWFFMLEMAGEGFLAPNGPDTPPAWVTVFALLFTAVEIAISILFCKLVEKRSLGSMGFFKKGRLRKYVTGYLLGAAMASIPIVIWLLTATATISITPQIAVGYVVIFFGAYLVQGLAEEVLFRGYFMMSLGNRLPIAIAIGISSVAFGIFHLFGYGFTVLGCVNPVLFGVFAALFFLRNGSIWSVAALHAAWNYFQSTIWGLPTYYPWNYFQQIFCQLWPTDLLQPSVFQPTFRWRDGLLGLPISRYDTIVLVAGICLVLFWPRKATATVQNAAQ